MAEHTARTEQMQAVVDELQQITTALEDALREADDAVTRLHNVWEGDGAVAHRAAHDRWSGDAEAMNKAVAQLRALLTIARGNYDAAAEANLRMWS
jgi:WXG100 family type VII secretion target